MQIKRRRRAVRASIAIGAAISTLCLWAVGQTPAHAAVAQVTQGVPAPYVTPANSSDPHTKPCVHNGVSGFCLFTSQDLRLGPVQYPSGQVNQYPMSETFGYFSTDGVNWSAPTVLMRESTYQSQGPGWVQPSVNGAAFSPLHLWAPSAQQGADGNWYLYVPDISDQANPSTSSFIGVSKASDPMGPYTPIGQVNIPVNARNANVPGYASDPDVVDTTSGPSGTTPYLAYNDGDFSNCGGVSIAPLSGNMTTLAGNPVHPVLDGVPSTWGAPNCTDVFGRTHLYMEGPHIYNTTLGGAAGNWPAGVPGPYLMVVPIKPNQTPPECALNVQGQPNTANELVAYFTATSPLGNLNSDGTRHWNYGGVLMCGSGSSEFTDQGSIMPITSHGHTALILVYHDGPGQDSTGHHRTLHAECLLWDAADTHGGGSGPGFNGNIAQSIRTAGTQFTDSGAESNCLTSFDSTSVAFRSPATSTNPPMFMSGNGAVTADRFDVGPWEKFQIKQNGATLPATFADLGKPQTNGVAILSEVNNSFVTTGGVGSCLNANSSTASQEFNFIPSPSSSGTGGTFIRSQMTGDGERSQPSAQVCDAGDAGTQWFVYHY
jgi:hypothetical protein